MIKWIAVIVAMSTLVFFSPLQADYISEREAALVLLKSGQPETAFVAFTKLAETATSDFQKSDALEQAALCADRLKQFDRALELARKIPLPAYSKNCQMEILLNNGKCGEVVAAFQDEDFTTWPESIRGHAYYLRGHAHHDAKNGVPAVHDLTQAVEFITNSNTQGFCLNLIGDSYLNLLQDDEQALQAYRRTYKLGTIYKQCQAAISVAEILKRQRKFATAAEEFSRLQLDPAMAPVWHGNVLVAWAEALAAAGKPQAGLAKCQAALALNGLPSDVRQRCEQAIQKLKAESK